MRHRIAIQKQKIGRDAAGGETVSWVYVSSSLPVEIDALSMRERFQAKQVQSEISIRFKLRYKAGIGPKMRAIYKDEPYDIEGVINVGERDRELVLHCSRVTT